MATLLSRYSTIAPAAVLGTMWLNGALAVRIDRAGELDTAVTFAPSSPRSVRK